MCECERVCVSVRECVQRLAATNCDTLRHTATRCNTRNTLQHAATRCNTPQHAAPQCNKRHVGRALAAANRDSKTDSERKSQRDSERDSEREGEKDGKKDSERERWGAGVETQKNVRGEIGGWGRVPFNETYAPSLSTIYDGA